jgi:hypothetical protein
MLFQFRPKPNKLVEQDLLFQEIPIFEYPILDLATRYNKNHDVDEVITFLSQKLLDINSMHQQSMVLLYDGSIPVQSILDDQSPQKISNIYIYNLLLLFIDYFRVSFVIIRFPRRL